MPEANPEEILQAAQLGDPDPPAEDDALEIYAALRENPARPPAADLRLASLHAQFFREMSERNLKLPATESETLSRVAAANTPAARAALSEITAQLFKLWRDFYAPENSPAAKHRRALAKLADEWKRPLFAVGPAAEREPTEFAFCERIQNRGGECFFLSPSDSPAAAFARNALSGAGDDTRESDSQALRAHFSAYREGGAASLHDAAALALSAVAEFAAGGAKHIGVVVFDRVLARRMNAMALAKGKARRRPRRLARGHIGVRGGAANDGRRGGGFVFAGFVFGNPARPAAFRRTKLFPRTGGRGMAARFAKRFAFADAIR